MIQLMPPAARWGLLETLWRMCGGGSLYDHFQCIRVEDDELQPFFRRDLGHFSTMIGGEAPFDG